MTYEDARDKFRISIPSGARSATPSKEHLHGSAYVLTLEIRADRGV